MATYGERRQRNGEIEFFRFVLAVAVVLFHTGTFLGWDNVLLIFPRGYLAVEAFFILTGYFLCQSWSKGNTSLISCLGRRIKGFYPELLVSLGIAFCFRCVFDVPDCGSLKLFFSSFVTEALLLKMTGILPPIREGVVNGPTWYLSSMMLATIPLYFYYKLRRADALLMLLCMAIFAALLHVTHDFISNPYIAVRGVYIGNIRALSEMGVGMCAFPVAAWMRERAFTRTQHAILAIVKYILFFLIICYMLTWVPNAHLLWLCGVWAWLVLAVSVQCRQFPAFACGISRCLGKISLPLFLSHGFYVVTWNRLMPTDTPDWLKVVCYLTAAVATTSAVMVASSLLRRCVPLFGKTAAPS